MKVELNKTAMKSPPSKCERCGSDDFCVSGASDKLSFACNSCRYFLMYAEPEDATPAICHAVMGFGKYKGRQVKEIGKFDPGYLDYIRINIKGEVKEALDFLFSSWRKTK
jgi:hypothetical protein